MKISSLGISQRKWSFLRRPKEYARIFADAPATTARKTLAPEPTARQFATARQIMRRLRTQYGLLLADDVGLGKTTVAALVACVFAGAGKRVRILAPNDVMARRWRDEVRQHVLPVGNAAGGALDEGQLAQAETRLHVAHERLRAHRIEVSTHVRAGRRAVLDCDLLIVDEAHRVRGEGTTLAQELRRQRGDRIGRILVLTATPFSIDVGDLVRVLQLVGADHETVAMVKRAAATLDHLWRGHFKDTQQFAARLGRHLEEAVREMRPFVIRHCVRDLPAEAKDFGPTDHWPMVVRAAEEEEIECLARADRLLQLAKGAGAWDMKRTNDPRFHEGYGHLATEVERVRTRLRSMRGGGSAHAALAHASWLERFLRKQRAHPKVEAVGVEIANVARAGEKVLAFCDHHVVAEELAKALSVVLAPRSKRRRVGSTRTWSRAWTEILHPDIAALIESAGKASAHTAMGRHFVRWLCCRGMREQVASWLEDVPNTPEELARALRRSRPRGARRGTRSIAEEARALFSVLTSPESGSTRTILAAGPNGLPGYGHREVRVMSTAWPDEPSRNSDRLFFWKQPDTVMAIFNSPFGPDVLVATDRLSEGVDLHRWCRHLVHFELDPSPIRTVQRNGRIRRVECWAARSRLPCRIAYPSFKGTRDEQLVRIMRERVTQFDLLLGGVTAPVSDATATDLAMRQEEVLDAANTSLRRLSLALRRG